MKKPKRETQKDFRPGPAHTGKISAAAGAESSVLKRLLPAVLTAAITFLVFIPALHNGFVNYDDGAFVYENRRITSMDPAFFRWAFTNLEYQWSPLRWISHALDYKIWKLDPFGHHLSNVVLHSVNAFLVVILVLALLEAALRNRRPQLPVEEEIQYRKKALIAGVVTGILFGIHPLRVESVAWVSERKDVLYAFFFLLSLITYLRYCTFSDKGEKKYFYYLLTLALFIMSLMSKAAAVTLPLVLFLLDFYPLERANFRSGPGVWRRIVLEKLPFLAAGVAVAWINIGVHESKGIVMSLGTIAPVDRFLLAIKSFAFYLLKMVWPFNLTLIYGEPYQVSFSAAEYIGLLVFVAAVTASCIFLWKRGKKLWLAVWIYYIVMFLPVSVIKIYAYSFANDRYTYMPSIGPFLLAGLGAGLLMEMTRGKKKAFFFSVLGAVFILLAGLTVRQAAVWKNSVTLWNSILDRAPRSMVAQRAPGIVSAYYSLGTAKLMLGAYNEAIRYFDSALEAGPFDRAYNNRGLAYKEKGDYQAAIRDFSRLMELQPDSPEAYNNRADVHLLTGNYQKAKEDLLKALSLNPQHVLTHINLCSLNTTTGEYQKALEACSAAIKTDPLNASAYKRRGFAHNAMGKYKEAVRDYDEAAVLDPRDHELYYFRGIARKNSGDLPMAVADFTQAVALRPGYFAVYIIRGVTYGELGRLEDAVRDFTTAIRLKPGDAAAYYNRGAALYQSGSKDDALKDFRTAAGLGDKTVQKILRERGIRY